MRISSFLTPMEPQGSIGVGPSRKSHIFARFEAPGRKSQFSAPGTTEKSLFSTSSELFDARLLLHVNKSAKTLQNTRFGLVLLLCD